MDRRQASLVFFSLALEQNFLILSLHCTPVREYPAALICSANFSYSSLFLAQPSIWNCTLSSPHKSMRHTVSCSDHATLIDNEHVRPSAQLGKFHGASRPAFTRRLETEPTRASTPAGPVTSARVNGVYYSERSRASPCQSTVPAPRLHDTFLRKRAGPVNGSVFCVRYPFDIDLLELTITADGRKPSISRFLLPGPTTVQ